MTDKVDRKLRQVRIAEYRYRHEAEFAAGFLEDAGIPYRLQIDDAGGADLGLSMQRPSAVWVRAVDADVARDLLSMDEEGLPATTATEVVHDAAVAALDRGDAPDGADASDRTDAIDLVDAADQVDGDGQMDADSKPRLGGQERVVSGGLSVALFSALPYLPFGPYRAWIAGLVLAGSVAFLAAAVAGRGPRPLERLIRMLSGSVPG